MLDYTLQNGLELGMNYTAGSYFPTATDGLRHITGIVNPDGTVTIYGITSTVSTSGDQGADPNEIVAITDALAATTLPASEMFSVLDGRNSASSTAGSRSTRCRNPERSF